MSSLDSARETQLKNIELKTGRTLEELRMVIKESGLQKHGQIRSMLIEKLGLGYGDANSLVFFALGTDGQSRASEQGLTTQSLVNEIYSGAKSELRPIHDLVMEEIRQFCEFEIAPKKGYLSLRRKRQFAMVGPGTRGRFEIGINIKGKEGDERFLTQPAGGMCQIKVYLTSLDDVDQDLKTWIKRGI
jgi:hypothetical protein